MFTIDTKRKVTVDSRIDQLYIGLSAKYLYGMIIGEEKNYFLNQNPHGSIAHYHKINPKKEANRYIVISLIERIQLNRESDPCNEDPEYSLQTCVKESFAKQVGCKLPWDTRSDQRRENCTKISEYRYRSIVKQNFILNFLSGLSFIIKTLPRK